jgi:hypothetical protein
MTRQEKKQLYLELLGMVNDKFPQQFADKTKLANPTLTYATINNVRYGRSPKLDVLIFLIRLHIPTFMIPQKFIDAEVHFRTAA